MLAVLSPAISIGALLPEIVLSAAGCVVLLLGQAQRASLRTSVQWVTLAAILLATALLVLIPAGDAAPEIRNGLLFDTLADFVRRSALIVGVLIVLVSWNSAVAGERGEFFAMALFSLAGLLFVGSAADFVMLFLAIELVSIPTYVMVTLSRTSAKALEAGTKYFYLGALAAALTAYGLAFLYGVAGRATMDREAMDRIVEALRSPGTLPHALATIGLIFTLGGLLFKIAAFPLHLYVADVYEGASSAVAGLLGFVPKLAGIVAMAKVLMLTQWSTTSGGLFWFLWLVAALSMTVGNVLAFRQNNLKRMLAFSGVAHGGYMILGLLAGPGVGNDGAIGTAATLFYVVVYGIANLGAFAVLGLLRVRGQPAERIADVAGLLRRAPALALLLALSMFALMGMPPTPGFWGKLGLFGSALAASQQLPADRQFWLVALVVIAGLNTAIGAAYYLRVIASVLLYENDDAAEPDGREAPQMGALLCGFLTIMFAVFPHVLLNPGSGAATSLRHPGSLSPTGMRAPAVAAAESPGAGGR